jgi:host factor-I protein
VKKDWRRHLMNKGPLNLQDLFLNQVRKERVPVTIYLTGGVQLKGMVKGFDAFTVMLESPGKTTQIVYKHAIASVVPSRQVNIPMAEGIKEEASETTEE